MQNESNVEAYPLSGRGRYGESTESVAFEDCVCAPHERARSSEREDEGQVCNSVFVFLIFSYPCSLTESSVFVLHIHTSLVQRDTLLPSTLDSILDFTSYLQTSKNKTDEWWLDGRRKEVYQRATGRWISMV